MQDKLKNVVNRVMDRNKRLVLRVTYGYPSPSPGYDPEKPDVDGDDTHHEKKRPHFDIDLWYILCALAGGCFIMTSCCCFFC